MPTLDIHLQEGFEGDEVVVRIDGEERMHRDAVHTRRALSLAEHVKFEVSAGAHVIEIAVPGRGVEQRIDVEVLEKLYVGVGLHGDELRVRVRDKQFGYA